MVTHDFHEGREVRLSHLRRIAPVLTQVDTTLHGSPVTVNIKDTAENVPAYSTPNGVFLSTGLDASTVTGLINVLGLNYHELAHVMFTRPFDAAEIGYGLHGAYNSLEDQRIENILISMFPNTKNYLTTTIATYFGDNPKGSFPLLWGRKYLPRELRRESRAAYIRDGGKFAHVELASIIDEYIQMPDPLSSATRKRATELITRYDALVLNQPGLCAANHTERGGKKHNPEMPSDLPEKVEADKESADGHDDGQSTSASYADAFNDAVESAVESATQQDDFAEVQRSARANAGVKPGSTTGITQVTPYRQPVTADMALIAKRVGERFLRLVQDNDPGWEPGNAYGKINMGRVVRGDSYDTIFDSWKEGRQEAGDMDAAILVDISGSTSHNNKEYNETLWILRRAIESLPGNVNVRARYFNDTSRQAPDAPVLANEYDVIASIGSTIPILALRQTLDDMLVSIKSNRLVIIITDGTWSNPEMCDGVINALNKAGVVTVLVNVGRSIVDLGDHGARFAHKVSSPSEMIGVVAKIVDHMIKESK